MFLLQALRVTHFITIFFLLCLYAVFPKIGAGMKLSYYEQQQGFYKAILVSSCMELVSLLMHRVPPISYISLIHFLVRFVYWKAQIVCKGAMKSYYHDC